MNDRGEGVVGGKDGDEFGDSFGDPFLPLDLEGTTREDRAVEERERAMVESFVDEGEGTESASVGGRVGVEGGEALGEELGREDEWASWWGG